MDLGTKNILNLVVVFAILSALTAGVDVKQFKQKLRRPKGVCIGLLCQFGILPVSSFLIAYALSNVFEVFSQPQGVALIILGSCPGGNISNIFTFLWNADLSLSIAMTTASSVLSFAFLTANCAIYIPIYTKGSDTAEIDYISLAFSVGMVVCGICVGFIAAYFDSKLMKKILAFCGFVATCYMIWTALFGNATGSAPIWTLDWRIWLGPLSLCSIAWILSLLISLIFCLPKKSVLTVCLESANQNSVLSAAIIYLSLDEYEQQEIDLAIGIPIMYTLICILFDALGGLIACQLNWVSCKLPDDPDYLEPEDEDETITLSNLVYRYKQYRLSKKTMILLANHEQDVDYGGTHYEQSVEATKYGAGEITLEQANFASGDDEVERSSGKQSHDEIL